MVGVEVVKETVKGCLKIYVRDAAIAYSSAFIGGCIAGASFIGLKDGLAFGKDLANGAKKGIKKLVTKKPKSTPAPEEPNTENNNPDNAQEA